MFRRLFAALGYLERKYWERGGEEIDPLGPARWRAGPQGEPWAHAVEQIVGYVRAKELSNILPEGEQKKALFESSSLALDAFIDELCPPHRRFKVPRRNPWPWPGPPPWAWEIASQLTGIANSADAGALRGPLLDAASQLVTRAGGNA
ncbi:MAG TPA: hypothetical protein VHM25_21480 [Polyangiaceae bacterium]|nr:hypothetical protein [Polyangiaceae bacterium]